MDRFVVLGAATVSFSLGAASLVNAVAGDRLGSTPLARHRVMAAAVGAGYVALAVLLVYFFRSSLSG